MSTERGIAGDSSPIGAACENDGQSSDGHATIVRRTRVGVGNERLRNRTAPIS